MSSADPRKSASLTAGVGHKSAFTPTRFRLNVLPPRSALLAKPEENRKRLLKRETIVTNLTFGLGGIFKSDSIGAGAKYLQNNCQKYA